MCIVLLHLPVWGKPHFVSLFCCLKQGLLETKARWCFNIVLGWEGGGGLDGGTDSGA